MINLQHVRLLKNLKNKHGHLNGESIEKKFRRLQSLSAPDIKLDQNTYNTQWQDYFEQEKNHLTAVNQFLQFTTIGHIGSTAIPGMSSKAIIDIAAYTEQSLLAMNIDEANPLTKTLTNLGYQNYGLSPIHEHCYWFWRQDNEYLIALHIAEQNNPCFHDSFLFRDFLKQKPEKITEYQTAKQKILQSDTDLFSYSVKKMDVYCDILAEARQGLGG